MSKYEVIISEFAEEDIIKILDYIQFELRQPIIAQSILKKIKSKILSLSEMPSRCNLVADEYLARKGYRKFLIDNYIIFFTISETELVVSIQRVLYSKREWEKLI